MRTGILAHGRILALCALAALPLFASAGKPTSSVRPLVAVILNTVVDEQDTNGYFQQSGHCPNGIEQPALLRPDTADGPTRAWDFPIRWTVRNNLVSGIYDNGSDCVSAGSCLRAEFSTNDKVFSLDTRSTWQPRKMIVDFGAAWDPATNQQIVNPPPFGATVSTPGLLQVSGLNPLTSMELCSSTACPEALQIATKFWFNDPRFADVMWRVDWRAIRVLRMSQTVWYFIADACGGSQLAGLSRLEGNRTRPRETLNGYYLIPMFFAAELK
jgi:hypothetical protein